MNELDFSGLPNDIRKEFAVETSTGIGSVSRRGLARLCGVSDTAIRKLLKTIENGANQRLSKMLEPFTGEALEGANQVPDTLASAIIKHYAYQGKQTAQDTDMALGAIGLRTVIQKMLGWEAPRQLTDKEIVALLVMPVPAPYSPKFEVEFYNHLSRLTGLKSNGHLRPNYWAALTKELVYDYMPAGVYEEIKKWQQCTDSDKKTKLHQYMSSSGTEVLMSHLKRLLTFMSGVSSLDELRWLLQQSASKQYQMSLFEPHTLKPQK